MVILVKMHAHVIVVVVVVVVAIVRVKIRIFISCTTVTVWVMWESPLLRWWRASQMSQNSVIGFADSLKLSCGIRAGIFIWVIA